MQFFLIIQGFHVEFNLLFQLQLVSVCLLIFLPTTYWRQIPIPEISISISWIQYTFTMLALSLLRLSWCPNYIFVDSNWRHKYVALIFSCTLFLIFIQLGMTLNCVIDISFSFVLVTQCSSIHFFHYAHLFFPVWTLPVYTTSF